MASSSYLNNPPDDANLARIQDQLAYLYASNTNVSNFVSVKLSGPRNYKLWMRQMLCLMKSHDMTDLLLDDGMKNCDGLLPEKYDALLRGWIFGSVTEDVLHIVVDHESAKDVWGKLKFFFDSTSMTSKQDSAPTKAVMKTKDENKDRDMVLEEKTMNDEDTISAKSEARTRIGIEGNSGGNHHQPPQYGGNNDTAGPVQQFPHGPPPPYGGQPPQYGDNNYTAAPVLHQFPHGPYGGQPPQYAANNYTAAPVQQSPNGHQRPPPSSSQPQPPYQAASLPTLEELMLDSSDLAAQVQQSPNGPQRPPPSSSQPQPPYQAASPPTLEDLHVIPPAPHYIDLAYGFSNSMMYNQPPAPSRRYITDLYGGSNMQLNNQETEAMSKDKEEYEKKREGVVISLQEFIRYGDWTDVYYLLREEKYAMSEIVSSTNGNTALHVAIGMGRSDILRVISYWHNRSNNKLDLTQIVNSNGSTVLHIAAIVGNINAAKQLLAAKEFENLLCFPDKEGKTPLDKACETMHLDMIDFLLEATEKHNNKRTTDLVDVPADERKSSLLHVEKDVELLANAISAKRYDLASKLIRRNPNYAVSNDAALIAMAKTFPSGLEYGENFIYPRLDNTRKLIIETSEWLADKLFEHEFLESMVYYTMEIFECNIQVLGLISFVVLLIMIAPVMAVCCIYVLLLTVYFISFMLHSFVWKLAEKVAVPAIKKIVLKNKEYEDAKEVLKLICKTIKEMRPDNTHDQFYTRPILEAARQDAYEVVDEILGIWPEAIQCEDKKGYDIIQLATLHRSERIYNLIYIMGERKRIYEAVLDRCNNNMLHLVARLAPSNKLKLKRGAALQLQRELQWLQEVQKLVLPINITKENIFMETPEMVFTKEHESLVKEGENWIKAVAESSSITAALITTIVFAAAITVPGGNNQETGVPVFLVQDAFTVFAIADAISLFSSATALLVFLSILTARFAEEDFLVRLPRRLIIGLFTLLLSTTALMVAFSATLFLVFSRHKLWVLAPICGLALVPIGFFFVLQFPLILDLFRSTYISKFGRTNHKTSEINPNSIGLYFTKRKDG